MASHQLSRAARTAWAKHDRDADTWLPLYQHMADSAAVAGHLWDEWVPESVRRQVAECFPDGADDARVAVTWLAAVHDLGKCSPAFAIQVPELAGPMESAGLTMPPSIPQSERRLAPHSVVSHVLLRQWLVRRFSWKRSSAETFAVIPGGHHGTPPSPADLTAIEDRPHLTGKSDSWKAAQEEFADYCADLSGASERLPYWKHTLLTPQAQVLVTAVVILADWIASNDALFPYDLDGRPVDQDARARHGLATLALPGPWRALAPPSAEDLFTDRFELPDGATPRPIQLAAYDLATASALPGLMIIEAPMGEGKTEAALAAAEVFAHRTGAGGCFIALPTMATSDAMFTRVRDWAERLPREVDAEPLSMYLSHSKFRLNNEFTGLMDGSIREVGVDEESNTAATATHDVVAHQWLFGRKKGVLADIVVGTIDQILFGALKSRHLALRHLALANKVVIIDEVHACDTYMSVYLDRVLEWLGSYRVPTIMLSATLPATRRRQLIEAYDAAARPSAVGSDATSPPRYLLPTAAEVLPGSSPYKVLDGDIGYPVITASTGATPLVQQIAASGRTIAVSVEFLSEDDESLLEVLRRDTRDGGCVAIIRNTVGRAQETKALLDAHFPGEVTLAHSRFLAADRARIESSLRAAFGPETDEGERVRPARHFVVGTQVLEQSLDVDFDLMVTDLAPLDLVLQRIGRLHRHSRAQNARPATLRTARCLVTGVDDWSADPAVAVAASRFVYGDSVLFRAASVLRAHLAASGTITLPDDIAPLVQTAYDAALQPPSGWELDWKRAELDAAELREAQLDSAGHFLLGKPVRHRRTPSIVGWIDRGAGEADDSGKGRAQVRDTGDGIEVIVVQRVAGMLRALPWLDKIGGEPLDSGITIAPRLARALAACTVRLPPLMTSPWLIDRVIDNLEANGIASWQSSPWLGGELVLVLDEDLRTEIAGLTVEYDPELGLTHTRTEGAAP